MRIKRSASYCVSCLLAWAACTSDPSQSEPPDPSNDGPPAASGGTGGMGMPGSPVLMADGGVTPQPEAGASDAQSAVPEAGSPPQRDAGTDGGAPAQGDAGPLRSCANKYTTAMYIAFEVTWTDTVGYLGGREPVQAWSKTTFTPTADGATIEAVPCGAANPTISGTPLVGGDQFANDIPVSAFEHPNMPRFAGRATWQAGKLVIDPGTNVIGASLSDPEGAWPFRASLSVVDHDGDGKPGLTAIQRADPPFGLPPGDILFSKYLDKVYIASRIKLRLTGASEGCSGPVEGSVEPIAFDYTIVGCHIVDGDDCGESEVSLLENQNPTFTLVPSGRWRSVPIAEGASCAEVRNALSAQ